MITQLCKYTKNHTIVHLIRMILINELYQENCFFKDKGEERTKQMERYRIGRTLVTKELLGGPVGRTQCFH